MATGAPRRAAVLLLLFENDGEDYAVFTRRTEQVATHKGQISLPGGSMEPTDASLLDAAIRETEEEVGITADQFQLIGELDDVFTVVSNFLIKPFIARLQIKPEYRPEAAEVAEVIEIPLALLGNPDSYWTEERSGPWGSHTVHFYKCGDYIIWGATARIVKHFLESSFSPRRLPDR